MQNGFLSLTNLKMGTVAIDVFRKVDTGLLLLNRRLFKVVKRPLTEEEKNTLKLKFVPKVSIAGYNDSRQHVKLAKFQGEFVWHKHENEDEMFLVVEGILKMELRDKTIEISKNEFLIVPKGTEHRPVAENEVLVMLFEPITTLNTGNTENELTKHILETI